MKLDTIKSVVVGSSLILGFSTARAQFTDVGNAYDYAVLVNSGNSSVNGTVTGNVGVGTGGSLNVNGPISGSLNFAGSSYSGQENQTPGSGVNYNVAEVNTILSDISALSSTYTGGASLAINASGTTQTVNASSGTYETSSAYGNAYVFDVTSVNLNDGGTLQIDGTSAEKVVLNVDGLNSEFNGSITLAGGLTSEDVIINIVGGEFQNTSGTTQNVTYVGENVAGGFNVAGQVNGPVIVGGSGPFEINSGGRVDFVAAVPEPGTWLAGMFLLLPIGLSAWQRIHHRLYPQA
jgi:hypothetical protein